MGAATFRHRLLQFTGFSGESAMKWFDAHHLIPKTLGPTLLNMGININSPIFGMFIKRDMHQLLHYRGTYDDYIVRFVQELERSGTTGAEAMERLLIFLEKDVVPKIEKVIF
jgi:hypothetical protein